MCYFKSSKIIINTILFLFLFSKGDGYPSESLLWVQQCLSAFPNLTKNGGDESGKVCPVLFDSWKCWPAAEAGETVTQPCPEFPHLGFKSSSKGPFTLRDETMCYWTRGSLITFNNGLGTLKTKSGGGDLKGGERRGDGLGGNFVLRGPNPFLKSDQFVMCLIAHG